MLEYFGEIEGVTELEDGTIVKVDYDGQVIYSSKMDDIVVFDLWKELINQHKLILDAEVFRRLHRLSRKFWECGFKPFNMEDSDLKFGLESPMGLHIARVFMLPNGFMLSVPGYHPYLLFDEEVGKASAIIHEAIS